MSTYFKLGFKNDMGRIFSLNVSDANSSLTATTIKTAMDSIIESDVLNFIGSDALYRESAELVETTTGEISI